MSILDKISDRFDKYYIIKMIQINIFGYFRLFWIYYHDIFRYFWLIQILYNYSNILDDFNRFLIIYIYIYIYIYI